MFTNFSRLISLLGPYRWWYFLSSFALIVSVFVRMAEPRVLQVAIDSVLRPVDGEQKSDYTTAFFEYFLSLAGEQSASFYLFLLAGLYLAIAAVRGGLMLVSSALSTSSSEKAVKRLRDRIFRHVQFLPMDYHGKMSSGELIQRSNGDIDTVRSFLLNQVVDVIRLTAIFAFAFYMMALIHLPYALISICLVPVIAVQGYRFFMREREVWKRHEEESDRLNEIARENLDAIRLVQAFGAGEAEKARFDNQNQAKLKIGLEHMRLHADFWPLSDLLVVLQMAVSILFGGYFAIMGAITIGQLAGFYFYLGMVAWPLRHVMRMLSQMGMALVAMGRIYEVLEQAEEQYRPENPEKVTASKIEFRNVSFRYKDDGPLVLENLSFVIEPGEKVAFIGPTGAGKSALIKLLLRFYEPVEGQILLNDRPLFHFDKKELRKAIGLVHQKAFLFSATLEDNIRYASPESRDPESFSHVVHAAGISHLEHVFSEGYQTLIGEKGVTLSGGQKQRVALARTLLGNPQILILDDVTSAVDTETELHILEHLEQDFKSKTVITISHRMTALLNCEKIFVLENGRITATGSPSTLVKREGYYQKMDALQNELESGIAEELLHLKEPE